MVALLESKFFMLVAKKLNYLDFLLAGEINPRAELLKN